MSRRLRTALALAALHPCLFCESPEPGAVGLFEADPGFSRRLGAAAGKTRLVAYMLCPDCFARGDLADLVESELLARLGGGA